MLKEKCGSDFNALVSEKVTIVPGDITYDDLGVRDSSLRQQMLDQIDAIVNLAATTKFDERSIVVLILKLATTTNLGMLVQFHVYLGLKVYNWCRYDVALGINALGAKHVINFAKECGKVEMLVHVSTG